MDVDAVNERARDSAAIFLDLQRRAFAGSLGVAQVSARTGIHGGDEHDLGRKGDDRMDSADGDVAVLQRLTDGLEDVAGELGEFVKKQDAVMGEAELAGRGDGASANEGGW